MSNLTKNDSVQEVISRFVSSATEILGGSVKDLIGGSILSVSLQLVAVISLSVIIVSHAKEKLSRVL